MSNNQKKDAELLGQQLQPDGWIIPSWLKKLKSGQSVYVYPDCRALDNVEPTTCKRCGKSWLKTSTEAKP